MFEYWNIQIFECLNRILKYSNTLMLVNLLNTVVCSFVCFFFHVVVLFILKMLAAGKRKSTHKSFRKKCQALKDPEKAKSNKNIAARYNVPKITLSAWVKNKETLFDALKKCFHNSTKKQLFLPKSWTLKTFRLQMAGYDAGRKEIIYHSKLFPRSSWFNASKDG